MYTGKTVLITGSSRGIGNMLLNHFVTNGARVIAVNREIEGDTNNLTTINIRYLICDLSKPDKITEAFDRIRDEKVDILINNAAVLTSQYFTRIPVSSMKDMVTIDLLAPMLVTKECLKLMKGDSGRIVNISSMAVALEPMGDSVYAACKAGLNTFTNILAKECAFLNITCNTLAVSAILTDMLKQLNKDKIDKVVAGLPIPRYATIEDITNVVDFFCSPKSNYITAQIIYLGGVH
jgi:3-oxoacyl-[acyl-carrier protein] reductase